MNPKRSTRFSAVWGGVQNLGVPGDVLNSTFTLVIDFVVFSSLCRLSLAYRRHRCSRFVHSAGPGRHEPILQLSNTLHGNTLDDSQVSSFVFDRQPSTWFVDGYVVHRAIAYDTCGMCVVLLVPHSNLHTV